MRLGEIYGRIFPTETCLRELRPISTQKNKNGIGPDRNKIEPAPITAFVTNFLFQFEPVIRNPDDKELKYFQLFWSSGADNTRCRRWKKVQSDPMLIFLKFVITRI